jgi:hypothetical protein
MSTRPKPKKQPNRRESGTLTKLQEALKLSKRRVSVLLAAGMPDDPAAALAWRDAKDNGDTVVALRKERIALVRQQQRKARIEADLSEGLLMPITQAHAESVHDACAVKAALLSLENTLPGKLSGVRDYSAIRELLHNEFRAVLNLLADGSFHRAEGVLEIVRQFHPNYTPTSEAER